MANDNYVRHKYRESTKYDVVIGLCRELKKLPHEITENYSWEEILLMNESMYFNTPIYVDSKDKNKKTRQEITNEANEIQNQGQTQAEKDFNLVKSIYLKGFMPKESFELAQMKYQQAIERQQKIDNEEIKDG